MRSLQYIALSVSFLLVLAIGARAQTILTLSQARQAGVLLDRGADDGLQLKCKIKSMPPFLDFAFRFDVGYIVRCPVKEFEGKQSTVWSFVRVTPEGGRPVIYGERFRLAALPENLRARVNLKTLKNQVDFSGGFAAGEGKYLVEVLVLLGESGRICRKKWEIKLARSRSEAKIPLAVDQGIAIPLTYLHWNGASKTPNGLRLTVVLDVAPIYPFSQKLRAWDRAFLLSTLSSVIDELPRRSLRLIAVNLDQQTELFREDNFDISGLRKLIAAMQNPELETVPVTVLEHREGAIELLARTANLEITDSSPLVP